MPLYTFPGLFMKHRRRLHKVIQQTSKVSWIGPLGTQFCEAIVDETYFILRRPFLRWEVCFGFMSLVKWSMATCLKVTRIAVKQLWCYSGSKINVIFTYTNIFYLKKGTETTHLHNHAKHTHTNEWFTYQVTYSYISYSSFCPEDKRWRNHMPEHFTFNSQYQNFIN